MSESTWREMKPEITLLLVWMLFYESQSLDEVTGVIVGDPSTVINLERITNYSVYCVVTSDLPNANSSFLNLFKKNNKIESQILNATAIVARINLLGEAGTSMCGIKKYTCKMKRFNSTIGIDTKAFFVGWPPEEILPEDFICISEHQNYTHCRFPVRHKCDLSTTFRLREVSANGVLRCNLQCSQNGTHWDCRNDSCALQNEELKVKYELFIKNSVGERTMHFNVTFWDIVRPGKLVKLEKGKHHATTAEVTWSMPELNIPRQFKYEFKLISDHRNLSQFATERKRINSFLLHNLIPHTTYKLMVRVQTVPTVSRPSDELYWSEWSTTKLKTLANRPIKAPVVAPGAYSIQNRKADLMNVSVFWQSVPDYLHNGTGFGYTVTAFSDTGQIITSKVSVSTHTFKNIPTGHYRIQVSCYNDAGGSEEFNEMHIPLPIESRNPQIRSVFKSGGYNVSWIAPRETGLSNYTLMICIFTSQGTCHDSTQFVTLPAGRTSFETTMDNALNFAVSANYPDKYSSELSWQHCVVAPSGSRLGSPKFHIESISASSMVVQMVDRCEERSFYQRMWICVRTLDGHEAFNGSYAHFVKKILVTGLDSDTDYEVIVTAFDRFGKSSEGGSRERTSSSDFFLFQMLVIACGGFLIVFMLIVGIRKLKLILDIKVELPIGLLEDQDDAEDTMSDCGSYEHYTNKTCSTILEESESVGEDIDLYEPEDISIILIPAKPYIKTTGETPISNGFYTSSKRPPDSIPDATVNGNYEQMIPPSKQRSIIRSKGYVKINMFINGARAGNYTQTIV